ncbi:unnamed protein product [Rangifer tarandus platyrhynchus]|uniref:Uncharacterized protein n=1 Tax=Rangifer tarandus platyrhynchus TaxID=3082113 RepID=A0AC59ZV06_RANTA
MVPPCAAAVPRGPSIRKAAGGQAPSHGMDPHPGLCHSPTLVTAAKSPAPGQQWQKSSEESERGCRGKVSCVARNRDEEIDSSKERNMNRYTPGQLLGGSAAIPVLQIIGAQSPVNQHRLPLASSAGKMAWRGTPRWLSGPLSPALRSALIEEADPDRRRTNPRASRCLGLPRIPPHAAIRQSRPAAAPPGGPIVGELSRRRPAPPALG